MNIVYLKLEKKLWYKENYKPVEVRKVREKTFNEKEYKKKWYNENKEVLSLKSKAYRMRKKWLNCMQMIIRGKIIYLPFTEMLEKPEYAKKEKYDKRKEQQRQFFLIKKYYEK